MLRLKRIALPGPPDSPLSQLKRLRRDFLGYLLDAARYGDLVVLKPAPTVRIVLVTRPDLVEDVLAGRPHLFRKSRVTRRMVGKFLGEGLVLSEGETHREARRRIQPAFHGARLARLAPLVANEAAAYLRAWPAKESRPLTDVLSQIMLRVVARTLFGIDADANAMPAMRQFAESMAQRFRSVPWPDWVPLPRHARENRAVAAIDRVVETILTQPHADGDDLLSLMRCQFNADELRDQIVTLYFAGHETSAKLLGWTLWRLARHHDVRSRVVDELSRLDAPTDAATSDRLPITDAVLKEVLRLHPPAWVFDREPIADIELGRVTLPAGTSMYLSPYVSHRSESAFPDPERFDPSRFIAQSAPLRGAYFPFGFGPRNCIGRGFAEMVARVLLATLVGEIELETITEPAPIPGATLGLGGNITVRRRAHPGIGVAA